MRYALLVLFLSLSLIACAPATPSAAATDREWALLTADYQWIQTLRDAQKKPAANASRKEQIELVLENHNKLLPTYSAFIDKVHAYLERTNDPRAAALLAREKILLGDEYMTILSRYDKAIALYREALEIEPTNAEANQRIAAAEQKRFVSMTAFSTLKTGMKEADVRKAIGLPREDWIKQVVQNNRVYAVWIYPKSDGGASAVYFDNGVVYHTNWNAAAPPARQ
jgi:tetratricopeptide (TPR) repeat protein